MGMTDAIDLTNEQRSQLNSFLRRFLPNVAVWAYGSRVKWTARPNSDLDLVAFTTPAQCPQVAELKDALAESNLPFPVDLHVWDEVPERFREIIGKEYVVVQEAKGPTLKQGLRDGWRERPLGELAEIFDGPHATPAKTQAGPIFLGISNLAQGRVSLSEVEHLSEDDYVRWTRRIEPRAGDVVFSYETRLGEAARVPQGLRCCLGRRMGLLRARREEIDERFLLYAYLGPQFQETLRSRTVPGSTVDRIPLIDIPQFPMVVPADLDEQCAIAHILGTLDDKIELNRRMNETLEAMARALFKSWFVDFDPVRAKAKGRDTGLPDHLADLFPNRLVESELGAIPEGWDVKPLESTLVLQRGFDLPSTQRTSGSYPVLAASGPSGTHNEFMVRGPGVTTGRSGVLGKVFYVHDDFWPLNTSLWVKEFRHSTPAYAFHLLYGLDFGLFNAGSAVPTLNRNHVHNLPTLLPPMGLIRAFECIAATSLKRQKHNDDQSQTVACLRDTLLPKLISGELRVKDAERFVERAM